MARLVDGGVEVYPRSVRAGRSSSSRLRRAIERSTGSTTSRQTDRPRWPVLGTPRLSAPEPRPHRVRPRCRAPADRSRAAQVGSRPHQRARERASTARGSVIADRTAAASDGGAGWSVVGFRSHQPFSSRYRSHTMYSRAPYSGASRAGRTSPEAARSTGFIPVTQARPSDRGTSTGRVTEAQRSVQWPDLRSLIRVVRIDSR